ncbi:MAG: hypothetical protein LBG83_05505 [Oscillospiraceae bacterium]|jgi:hypothetical protein|nr:hypothetical protein [Oscillospiraceae bacterium]
MKAILAKLDLKPETGRLLRHCAALIVLLYTAAVLFFAFAGRGLDYQQGLIVSRSLMRGLKAGFGLLCIGVMLMECK